MSNKSIKNSNIYEWVKKFQKNEITEHILYGKLAGKIKGKNGKLLKKIFADEIKLFLSRLLKVYLSENYLLRCC